MRVAIGAPHGRSGKTTVTLGIMSAMRKKGLLVQPFKKGPDYIDPGWLTLAGGRPCRNLDLYFLDPEQLTRVFVAGSQGADIAVIEGAMGLFDGLDLEGSDSTAAVARTVQAPVILVVDATRMTRSAAALVKGFRDFDPELRMAGIVLNRVARPRHEDMLVRSIETYTGVPVVGAVPRSQETEIADRHLGLIPAGEWEHTLDRLYHITELVSEAVDLSRILGIAAIAPPLPDQENLPLNKASGEVRIGVIKDQVFSFYYPENLEALQQAGAQLVYVNSLEQERLPDIDALYIGGGFPEVFAEQLEANLSLRLDIRRAAAQGLPIYAECGGLMYLARKLHTGGRSYQMCGAVPCETKMMLRPRGHGYTCMETSLDTYLFPAHTLVRGHEFHNSQAFNFNHGEVRFMYKVQRGFGLDGYVDGITFRNVIAAYHHIYAPAHPEWAEHLVNMARGRSRCSYYNVNG